MNLTSLPDIPLETSRAARSVFGSSNFYLVAGDHSDQLFSGIDLQQPQGRPLIAPHSLARLYLLTTFQYIESLPDSLAADALRKRLDWQYALHLPLNTPGLQPALLCDFRRWLRMNPASRHNLDTLLQRLSSLEEYSGVADARLEVDQVITVVCEISRVAILWEAFKEALAALAASQPSWLLETSQPYWYERYGSHHRYLNLRNDRRKNRTLAQGIGADARYLLEAVDQAGAPDLANLPEVAALRQALRAQFDTIESVLVWKPDACANCPYPSAEMSTFPGVNRIN